MARAVPYRHTLALGAVADEDARSSAADVAAALFDEGTFVVWAPAVAVPADAAYAAQLARAAARSGVAESIVAGAGLIHGRPVALVAGEFGFLAGSVGMAAADHFIAAMRRATVEGLPVLAAPTSGGTRMQEGTPAFLRMVPVAQAVALHRRAGLPYAVWLRDPTTGGVMATWGSLGQVTAAEPGALAGFLGPRVFQAMTGEQFPAGVQQAEHLTDVGVIDAVVALADLRQWLGGFLAAAVPRVDPAAVTPSPAAAVAATAEEVPLPDAWDCVLATRRPQRPGVRELLTAAATDVTWLAGTGSGERDDAIILATARIGGVGVVVVGQDRSVGRAFGPGGLRTARRGYALAAELGLPLLTVVDTEGAEVSAAAEEGAMAGEIARSLAELSVLDTPIVGVLLGSGCGGGALAMAPSDVLLAASDSWITPLPPEGASAIVHRTSDRAPAMARAQRITAVELHRLGVIDELLGAPGEDPGTFLAHTGRAVAAAVARARPGERRVARFTVAGP